jgi:hypothetical protein
MFVISKENSEFFFWDKFYIYKNMLEIEQRSILLNFRKRKIMFRGHMCIYINKYKDKVFEGL